MKYLFEYLSQPMLWFWYFLFCVIIFLSNYLLNQGPVVAYSNRSGEQHVKQFEDRVKAMLKQ